MCGVSLKDRKRSEDLCNLLGINCVADVVRRGRLRWFGHLEHKSVDDWVSACRGLVVEGTRGRGRSRKTWEQCVRDDMKLLDLPPEWAVFRDMWRDLIWGKRLTLAQRGKMDVLKINDDDDDDDDDVKYSTLIFFQDSMPLEINARVESLEHDQAVEVRVLTLKVKTLLKNQEIKIQSQCDQNQNVASNGNFICALCRTVSPSPCMICRYDSLQTYRMLPVASISDTVPR